MLHQRAEIHKVTLFDTIGGKKKTNNEERKKKKNNIVTIIHRTKTNKRNEKRK